MLQKVHKKRYAASAEGFKPTNKVYLFGGRSDFNNVMVPGIEEYDVASDKWNEINIVEGADLWRPVEICACITISKDSIIVFGGSDARIKD